MTGDSENKTGEDFTLILPKGLSRDSYHKLSEKLVGKYVTLSALESAPSETTPILNDSTWTLAVPTASGQSMAAIKSRIQSIPEAKDVEIEIAPKFGVSSREGG